MAEVPWWVNALSIYEGVTNPLAPYKGVDLYNRLSDKYAQQEDLNALKPYMQQYTQNENALKEMRDTMRMSDAYTAQDLEAARQAYGYKPLSADLTKFQTQGGVAAASKLMDQQRSAEGLTDFTLLPTTEQELKSQLAAGNVKASDLDNLMKGVTSANSQGVDLQRKQQGVQEGVYDLAAKRDAQAKRAQDEYLAGNVEDLRRYSRTLMQPSVDPTDNVMRYPNYKDVLGKLQAEGADRGMTGNEWQQVLTNAAAEMQGQYNSDPRYLTKIKDVNNETVTMMPNQYGYTDKKLNESAPKTYNITNIAGREDDRLIKNKRLMDDDPVVKKYSKTMETFGTIQKAVKTGENGPLDNAILMTWGKGLDPDSAYMLGEMERDAKFQSVAQQARAGVMNMVESGKLDPKYRSALKALVDYTLNKRKTAYDATVDTYRKRLIRQGLNQEDVKGMFRKHDEIYAGENAQDPKALQAAAQAELARRRGGK